MSEAKYPLCARAGLKLKRCLGGDTHIRAADVEKLLEGAPVVYGVFDNGKPCCWSYVCDTEGSKDTHAARLIMIEPIKPKSLEDKISEILDDHSKSATESLTAIRRLLEAK